MTLEERLEEWTEFQISIVLCIVTSGTLLIARHVISEWQGIGNGVPLTAVVTTGEVDPVMNQFLHFNTFWWQPSLLSCWSSSARGFGQREASTALCYGWPTFAKSVCTPFPKNLIVCLRFPPNLYSQACSEINPDQDSCLEHEWFALWLIHMRNKTSQFSCTFSWNGYIWWTSFAWAPREHGITWNQKRTALGWWTRDERGRRSCPLDTVKELMQSCQPLVERNYASVRSISAQPSIREGV